MERVKIFNGDNLSYLEDGINRWLNYMGTRIEITRVTQSSAGYATIISIFYKKKHHFCLDP